MKISELIIKLKEIQDTHGDLLVCVSETHEYWGSIETRLTDSSMQINEYAAPDGPKCESIKSLVFKY